MTLPADLLVESLCYLTRKEISQSVQLVCRQFSLVAWDARVRPLHCIDKVRVEFTLSDYRGSEFLDAAIDGLLAVNHLIGDLFPTYPAKSRNGLLFHPDEPNKESYWSCEDLTPHLQFLNSLVRIASVRVNYGTLLRRDYREGEKGSLFDVLSSMSDCFIGTELHFSYPMRAFTSVADLRSYLGEVLLRAIFPHCSKITLEGPQIHLNAEDDALLSMSAIMSCPRVELNIYGYLVPFSLPNADGSVRLMVSEEEIGEWLHHHLVGKVEGVEERQLHLGAYYYRDYSFQKTIDQAKEGISLVDPSGESPSFTLIFRQSNLEEFTLVNAEAGMELSLRLRKDDELATAYFPNWWRLKRVKRV